MKDMIYKVLSIVIPIVLAALQKVLTNEQFVKYGDMILDLCENKIKETATTLDDEFLLPLINIIREMAKIPDLPDA